MADVINLRQKRKQKARTEKEGKAEQNRRFYGRTKAEKELKKKEEARRARHLEGHRLGEEEE
jgi:hypothetical protein